MPNTKSARKALRQSMKRQQRNLLKKKRTKSVTLQIKKLVREGKKDEAKALLPQAYKALDKAAKIYLHKNAAARRKSRLTRLVMK